MTRRRSHAIHLGTVSTLAAAFLTACASPHLLRGTPRRLRPRPTRPRPRHRDRPRRPRRRDGVTDDDEVEVQPVCAVEDDDEIEVVGDDLCLDDDGQGTYWWWLYPRGAYPVGSRHPSSLAHSKVAPGSSNASTYRSGSTVRVPTTGGFGGSAKGGSGGS